MDKDYGLYRCLARVQEDADSKITFYKQQLANKPASEDESKWSEYWNKQIAEAEAARHYCFIRQMQISPD